MPHIEIHTNVELGKAESDKLAQQCFELCVDSLGKPGQYVQSLVAPGVSLVHGGTGDPAAYVELKSIGLDPAATPQLSADICALLQAELSIDPGRVYIEFKDLERALFGWNSKTF